MSDKTTTTCDKPAVNGDMDFTPTPFNPSTLLQEFSNTVGSCRKDLNDGFQISETAADKPQEEFLESLSNQLKSFDGKFSGAIAISRNGETIFSDAVGLAHRQTDTAPEVKASDTTQFNIASMGKMFTATAIMQLVQDGKISLDDSLAKYVKNLPEKDQERAEQIKIHQLLSHTAGTGDFLDKPGYQKLENIDAFIEKYGLGLNDGEQRDAGAFNYSNMGYMLLGKVIENAAKMSYQAYLQQKIFTPAGMNSTEFIPASHHSPGVATGYFGDNLTDATPNNDRLPFKGTPAGGAYSTVGDMLRFADKLVHDKINPLLDPKHLQTLLSSAFQHSDNPGGENSVGHSGGENGITGDLSIYLKSGYSVVILSNLAGVEGDSESARSLSHFIDKRLPTSP